MKKIIVIFLLVFIIVNAFFLIFRYQSMSTEDNFFNRNLRSKISPHLFFRKILSLQFDGDAAADYLSEKFQKITIEVDTMKGLSFEEDALQLLVEKISAVTNKPVELIVSDSNIDYQVTVTTDDVTQIEKMFRNYFNRGDQATVYLLGLSRDAQNASTMGLTHHEDGLIVFLDELQEFAADNLSVLPYYTASTALHEFGHQLGLSHNEIPGCLMGEFAEQSHVARQSGESVVTDFCDYEKSEIEEINKRYN
jgi:predicted Zn-dependent protease